MEREVRDASISLPSHLPPRDAWAVDPDKLRKFYAPVDDRGFVMLEETIETVKELFDPEYTWPVDERFQQAKPDLHHFHWVARMYDPSYHDGNRVPIQFRELPTVKGILPRQFHNVMHAVTLPPKMPEYEDMERHYNSYMLARQLFRTAQAAARTRHRFAESRIVGDSRDEIANEMLIQKFDRQFQGYREAIERLMDEEGLETLRLDIKDLPRRKPHEVVKLLGRAVVSREINFVPLFKHEPLAAGAT